MSTLLRPADRTGDCALTPRDAGWRYIGFEVHVFPPGARLDVDLATRECGIIVLSGVVDIDAGAGGRWTGVGGRADVFEAPPHGVYLPAGGGASIAASSAAEVALCFAESDRTGTARRIEPDGIEVETRGAGQATRSIRHVIAPAFPAHRLLVVEVLTPSGNWSSYPPHKHDVDAPPGEAALEEVYYHRQQPADGFAFQRVYTDDRAIDETLTVHDRDLVLVPRGYHVVAQAYGYQGYYLNVLAGERRSMAASDDAPYRWIRDEWRTDGTAQ
ncbi:MAG: 5-deoxy-glucuronate isomerase [Chloroflexota bacterium]|nr:5-deoxy-glucuronate isomerase [Chloroflexota bacterium]